MAEFDLYGAKQAGASDTEIATFLATWVPDFDIAGARAAGADDTAIVNFLLPRSNYETQIAPDQESAFRAWRAANAPNDSGADYDLRGAFAAGVKPDPVTGHWPDTFKKPNHPTFSDESQYAQYGKPGRWDGDTFVPAATVAPLSVAPNVVKPDPSWLRYVGYVGQQLVDAAFYHLPAAVAATIEGGYDTERDWKDALIERANAKAKERNANPDIPDAVKSLGPSVGASLVSMIGGIGAGLGTAAGLAATGAGAVAAPVAGWTAGVAASGALAYRISTNQFARQLYDAANANALDRTGAPISPEEWAAKRDELAPLIAEYGLWEAVPEALSQGLGLKIISVPIKAGITSIFGKSVLTRLTTKTAAVLGTELATETITQQGQRNVEVEATGEGTPRSWTSAADLGDSFTDVAAATILQTAIMGGGTKLALNLRDRIKRGGLTREQFDTIQEFNNMVDNGQIDPEGAREAAIRLLDPNAYDPNLIRPRDYPDDREATPVGAMSTTKEMVHAAADRAGMPWDNDPAFMDLTERLTGKRELDKLTPRELTALKEAIEEVAPPLTIAPVAPRPTAAAIEATLAKNKAVLLTGSEGIGPVVERVVNENETVEDFAAAANLAVGTGPNSVANFIAQGYAEIPGVSEYYTRLTKTNADKTVRTVDVSSNGDVENDTTLLGNYTVNGTPISIRFNNRQKILQSIEEDGAVMDSSEKATRSYIGGVPLLDILRAEDVNATVAPVTETVAPAVTEVAAPVTETVAPAETEAAIEQNRDRRNPASVLQMQQIANAPDYLRAGVGTSLANDAPIVAGGAIPAEQLGRRGNAVDSEGNRTKVQYAVVDASTVLTSNTVDGAVNPDYAGSSELRAIAGNGRITGFREAYARGTADNYRAEFEADTLHGIDPEVVRSVPNPILVRVMSEADITSDMGDRTNTATQLGMNPEETARNDANRVDLNTLDFRENGDPTAEATRAFLRGMPDNERATLLDGQVPTRDATLRLMRAIFFKAYNDPGLMSQHTTSEDGRTVISVLTQLAPVMSRLDQAGDLDIRNIVVDAAKIVIKAGKEGIPLSEAARQSDLTVKSDANLVVALMAEKPGGVKNTVEVLRSVANFAYAEATKPETDMFGVTPRATRADVVAKLRAALSPAGAQLVMPGTEAVAPPPSLAVELARLEGRQTKMGRTGQEAPGGIFTAAEAAKQGELALPQNILDLAEKWFNAYQNMIDNTEYTPEGEGRVAGKYKAASTMTFRRLSTALKKIEPNDAKRLEILQDLFRKNGAKVAASQAAPAVEPGLKSVGVGANGQSVAAVRAQMVPLKGITVEVVQSASELPETAAPSMAEGAWYSGTTVYLVADNLPNARRVQEVLAHEAIGHAALETMLGPQLMAELLTNVQTLERLGGRQIRAIAAYVDQRQPGLAPTDRAKEIIAVMAERGEYTNSSVWRRAIEAVRSWLRTQGFTIAFSNQDVLAMLRDAEKFANRAPETTAATGGRYSVAEGEASVTRSKPDINKKRMVKLLGPQLYGDMRDIAPVTVKELFQNSFDAVKGALERGDISLGHISITTDQAARTITIVDDGGGMAVDTINKAFLTMAGTEKDTERASGGLGIAKMLFLLGNKALSLETVRSGQVSRMTTSGSQITETLDNPDLAPLIETRSTTAAPGTTVVVTIPETYVDNDTNEVTDIPFPNDYFLFALIDSSPLLANIEVKLNDSVRPIGANYDLNGATVLTEVKFPWGTARLLVRPNKYPAPQNLSVLSEGLNQFTLRISKDPGDPYSGAVPYDFLLNLEPTVKADSPRYPIALNRQGFSASAKSDMGALLDYVNVLYANKTDQDSAKTFGALELLERVPGGYQIKNVSLQIPDAAVGTVLSINPTDNVKVVDGRVIVNSRPMPPLTKDNVKAMRRNPQQFRVDQSLIDKDAVIFHDNVLTDGKPLLAEARAALGAGPVNEYLNGLGGIIQDLRAATARVGGANYASVTDIPTGLSFDTTYYGVNTTIPFKAIMLNPMVVRDPATGYSMTPNTLSRADRAGTLVGTIVHELVHHAEKNHSETGFIPELARVSVQLAVSGDLAIAVQNVNQLLQRYDAVAEYFMEKNANGNITARGVRLAGNAERTGPGVSERPAGARGTGRNGENAVREGVGRGDTAGTGSQERGGPAAEGGRGAAVGDIRYSVKSDKMGATGTAKAWVEFAEVKKLIDFGVVKTLAQAKAAAEADYTKTFDALPAFDAKAYLDGVIAVEGPLLPQNIQDAVQAYKDGDEGGAVGMLLADVKRAREENIGRWKNYFDNVNTEQGSDPFWKSYVARSVVGSFDATKPNTGETFNAAALATVYGKFLEGTAPNFTKAYRAAKMAATTNLVQLGDAQNGWRKVPQTAASDPNFKDRVAEVQAISSESWCTKTYNAGPYIQKGDFWVYVDKGRPELAIRFEGDTVAEIQGRANNGGIPSQYAGEVQALVDSGKIQNLKPETKRALQAATDMSIARKKLESETTFVEEITGDGTNTRVYRKTNGDIVILTEGRPGVPVKYADRVVEVIGDLILYKSAGANNLTTVRGNLTLYEGARANNLTTVGGDLYLSGGAQANNLTTVGGNLTLYEGAQANNLTTVGGNLTLYDGAQANNLTTEGGNLTLRKGARANNLTTVGGNLYISRGAHANNLTTVGGNLVLYDGAQANNLTTVGGNLALYEGAQALSLQAVGGHSTGNTPENTPRLKYIGDKEAVERIKAETLSARVVTTGRTTAEVRAAIANAVKKLRIKINVYATVAEARAATGVDIPADALGMYSKNELHFIAENISSELNAEITLWHEVTHAGLDRLYGFGSAQYNAALTTIALRNPEIQREAAKWRAKFGADILQRAQDRGVTAERADQYVRMRAIDEALAVMSSQNVTIRGLDKFIAAVQKILRQVGLTKLADAMEGKTNAEALALISKARGAVMADGSYVVTDSVPAFSRGAGFMGNRTEPTLPVPETKTEKRLDSAVYNYVDRFVDLKNLMKTIKTQAAALPEALDAYSMVERLTSIVAKRLEDFGLREIGPLKTEMKARGVDVPSLDRYLWMRAAEDANRIIAAQPDTKFPNFDGAGVSTTDAQAYLAALTPAQRTAFEALARRVDAITAKTRREWVNAGLATLDDVLKMEREQPYYAPLNREGKGLGAGSGQGVSVRGPNTFHRRGSDLPVVDVLANLIHQRERAVTRDQKNLIARAIYTLAKAFPDADTWSLAKPGLTSAIDAETGEPVNILDMSYQKDNNVLMSIRLDRDGKMVSQGVAFNEENPQAMRMVGALKNLDLPSLQGLLGGTALVTRYFAALNTQYNPIFGIINFLRDVPTGLLNLSTTPIAGKQGAVFLRVGPSLAAIYKGARARRGGLSPVATEYDNYFERLRNAGGTSGWRQSYETSADRGKALQKELESLSSGVANKILPAIGGWLSDYNTAMENSVRLAAFITAVESGMSDAQAASLAKNLTVNFDRKGARSSQIGALFAFFNPSVQGTVRTFETLSGPAGKKIIAGGLLLGAVQAVILAMAGFDDDDPPEFVRQRNVIIPIGDKKYVLFPMPLGFNIIPNIGRLAMQTVLRPQNIGKNVFSVLDATLSTFNPFGSGVSLQTITPTALDPLVAIATNTDWTGRPIEREDFSSLDPTPGFTRAKDNATAVNKVIAEAINTLTGGNKYTPGKWSPTPDLLDYVAGQLTGGPGRELIHLESSVEGWLTGKEVPTYKVPLVGRFYGNVGSAASDKARYYENIKTLNGLENNIKGMQKDRVSAAAFRQDNPQARLIPAANVIKRQISQFRAQKDRPNNDDVKTDALILRQMQRLNALVVPYNAPTTQQKFLRGSVAE